MLKYDEYVKYRKISENSILLDSSTLNESAIRGYGENEIDQDDALMVAAKADCERAATFMMTKFKFFGEFIYRMRWIYTYDPDVPTMATDGLTIYINPNFCASLTSNEVLFVLCHEILHNVMSHFIRERSFLGAKPSSGNHSKWNMAADYEINPMVVDALVEKNGEYLIKPEHFKDPKAFGGGGGLYDEKYLNMSAEAIYRMLEQPDEDGDEDDDMYPAQPGMVIRSKDGKFGVIEKIDSNGKFDIKEITQAEAEKILKK
jgi:hypothetical protein